MELESWRNPERDLRLVERRDYAPNLRALLDRDALEEVVDAARDIFPDLNRHHDAATVEGWLNGDPSNHLQKLFAQVTNRRDIHFQSTPFKGEGGEALRGFFVDRDGETLARPLIYVNTAHHPVAVAATLFHEVGHLVASEVFAPQHQHGPVQFFFDVDYASHLDDLRELTADVVLSLAAYPAETARKLFGSAGKADPRTRASHLPDQMLSRISEHYRTHFGVSIVAADIPPSRKLNYLGGMIHFAKLRSALLSEYGV
jgi:hypothetical protein